MELRSDLRLRALQAGRPGWVWRVEWWRLPAMGAVAVLVGGCDLWWKAGAIAASHGVPIDAPSSPARPLGTLLIGLVALAGVMLLPRLCVPGALLVAGGIAANLASLVLWQGVPDPLGVAIGGGVLHFNLADLCIYGGGLLFLAATYWTVWRMPADRFA